MQEKDLLYIHLMNGEILIARFTMEDNQHLIVDHPMMIEQKIDGMSESINLLKYLPFSSDQYLSLHKSHVIDISPVTTEFEKYYYNSWEFNTLYVQPQTDANLKELNKNMDEVLRPESKEFVNTVKNNLNRIPHVTSSKLH